MTTTVTEGEVEKPLTIVGEVQKINTKWNRRYLDEFVRLKCAPQLLEERLFPNAKEISETMATFAMTRKILGPTRLGDPSVLALDIGCGGSPRTASFVALMTRWTTRAIDPNLRRMDVPFKRVTCIRAKIEDCVVTHNGMVVALCVHSHATLPSVLQAIQAPDLLVVAMPCCKPHESVGGPCLEVDDFACLSPERRVRAWRYERDPKGYWRAADIQYAELTIKVDSTHDPEEETEKAVPATKPECRDTVLTEDLQLDDPSTVECTSC